ncbi:MAG: RIFT barrel domain-containing protein [Planctomycetota bacterium]|jgi:hypothetical protein
MMRPLAAALCVAVTAIPAAARTDGVPVTVRNLGEKPAAGAVVTFGQAFRKGHFMAGVAGQIGGEAIPLQADVKRHYDDGSVRFAVITARVGDVPAGGEVKMLLIPGPNRPAKAPTVSLAQLSRNGFDVVVKLTFPDGTVRTAGPPKVFAEAPVMWLRGPQVTEWTLSTISTDDEGRVDEDLVVLLDVRAYAGGKRARVSVTVENCRDTWAGNIRYDVEISIGGRKVFERKAVDHGRSSRWRKVFWWPEAPPKLHVAHDLKYLLSTGALPNYDVTLTPKPPRRRPVPLTGPKWDILGSGSLTRYMPTTGGRPEIAPYPTWTVRYLLTMDPDAKRLVLANGDLAGSWPIHIRSGKTERVLTIDERPKFWADSRGRDRPVWKADRATSRRRERPFVPDKAHQPSLAYVPYLVTGDRYYLDEAQFWAGWCLLVTWDAPRQGARGLLRGQIRGDAWALRNVADAAWISPDGDPVGRYLDEKVRNNIAWRIEKMYGPPAYNKLGWWGIRTTADARIRNPANPNWMIIAPWEHDYLMWSLHHLVELGYADAAKVRNFLLRWRVGTLTNAPDFDPLLATPYRMVVGERGPDRKVTFYEDWKKLGVENRRLTGRGGLPNYGNSYAYSARAAVVCGIDGRFPRAREALKWLEANLPRHRDVMAANPSWAIVPRTVVPKP